MPPRYCQVGVEVQVSHSALLTDTQGGGSSLLLGGAEVQALHTVSADIAGGGIQPASRNGSPGFLLGFLWNRPNRVLWSPAITSRDSWGLAS